MQRTAGGVLGVCDPPTPPSLPVPVRGAGTAERIPVPVRSPRRRPRGVGTADFLRAQSESLFTSGISQRHIKESRQVQVNHEMVTF